MNTRMDMPPGCEPHRDALLLLACGDAALDDLPAATHAHLAECAACRGELAQLRDSAAVLAVALAPEAMPAGLDDRIRRRVAGMAPAERAANARGRRYMLRLPAVGFAAAAGLALALLIPGLGTPDAGGATSTRLAPDEQAELVSALVLLQWEGPFDYYVDQIEGRLDDVDAGLEGQPESSSWLPWGPDEDWDLPPAAGDAPADEPAGESASAAARLRCG